MNEAKLIQMLISPYRSHNFVTCRALVKGIVSGTFFLESKFSSYISTCDARKSVFFSRNTVHDKYIIKFKFCQLNSGLFSFLFATLLNWAARIHRIKIFTSQLFFFSQADLIMNRTIIVLFVATFACFYFIVSKRLIIRDIYIYM